jgi:hypothetical protein
MAGDTIEGVDVAGHSDCKLDYNHCWIHMIPGKGHVPNEVHAEEINEVLTRFNYFIDAIQGDDKEKWQLLAKAVVDSWQAFWAETHRHGGWPEVGFTRDQHGLACLQLVGRPFWCPMDDKAYPENWESHPWAYMNDTGEQPVI